MNLLAIDTATEACSVALWLDGKVIEHFAVAGREQAQRLPQMFAAVLAEAGLAPAQLDGLVAGIGPGSFAGVRVGIAFVKGLGLGLDRPAAGVSSLAVLAQGAIRERGANRVLAAIDARMDQVYLGAYRCEDARAVLCGEESVLAPEHVPPVSFDEDYVAAGTGWETYGERLRVRLARTPAWIDGTALPRARDAITLALPVFAEGRARPAAELAPNYLRNRVALTQAEQLAARR